jgi:2-aminoethylphosphonate transport system substrate-binding protein
MRAPLLRPAVAGLLLALALSACGGTTSSSSQPAGGAKGGTVTVYSADGLADWYTKRFAAFQQQTGVKVQYVEAGSGEVVSRLAKERPNPQADVVVTLPPFIQKAGQQGLLQAAGIDTAHVPAAGKDPGGRWVDLVDNYLGFIVNPTAKPAPRTWQDLLDRRFKGKLQYSTPGQAGDGTAVLVLLEHVLGRQGALDYLAKLQQNNVGPSSSTGKLQPKVSKGELYVANGDLQMNLASINNDGANFEVFIPAAASGARTTLSLPYVMGLAAGAPHAADARRLMGYLLSADAQKAVAADALGKPVRDDVTPDDAHYRQITAALDGVTVWNPDWNAVLANLDADLAAYQKAVGG